jgi:hypothetical protein
MLYPMLPGEPLTNEEAERVAERLVQLIKSGDEATHWRSARSGEKPYKDSWSAPSRWVLQQLGWQQHRLPDLRRFLERGPGTSLLSERFGLEVSEPFVSRSTVALRFSKAQS